MAVLTLKRGDPSWFATTAPVPTPGATYVLDTRSGGAQDITAATTLAGALSVGTLNNSSSPAAGFVQNFEHNGDLAWGDIQIGGPTWNTPGPIQNQTQYFWDLVVWNPAS